ncbi:MAG: hypothetical protein A2138_25025 [Deltaproteobacteria bacterium RBG_16_71_12]|nr:MAG: hypothetical protein A2138_25025 [Deltaproteobacteria bacterium RBG_16_71_12]
MSNDCCTACASASPTTSAGKANSGASGLLPRIPWPGTSKVFDEGILVSMGGQPASAATTKSPSGASSVRMT